MSDTDESKDLDCSNLSRGQRQRLINFELLQQRMASLVCIDEQEYMMRGNSGGDRSNTSIDNVVASTTNTNTGGGGVICVLGSQWGDEGKGKLVDIIGAQVDVVARCGGGGYSVGGHKVLVGDVEYTFHQIPSGVVNPKCIALLGNGVVIHLGELLDEIAVNEAKGLMGLRKRLFISNRAHLVFEFHQTMDTMAEKCKEKSSGKNLGTTKRGIGPAYSTKSFRSGIRVCDLLEFKRFEEKFRSLAANIMAMYPGLLVHIRKELQQYRLYAEHIRSYVIDTVEYLHNAIAQSKRILVEGSGAAMLDIDFGTYPFVTSSNCTIGGVCTGLGIPPRDIGKVFGVMKAYCTRSGNGPFPTELCNEIGNHLQKYGNESGDYTIISDTDIASTSTAATTTTTGIKDDRALRYGWLDTVQLRYTNMINGYTALAMTKLDVLGGLDEIRVGVAYRINGKICRIPPSDEDQLARVKVDYITMPGWKEEAISECESFDDLPLNAQNYIRLVENLVEVPIKWVSVGSPRESIIQLF